jgi:energy-coupling factor transporter ATP-binding protein EcfA2
MLNNFHSDHLTDLQKSGLSDESILSAGIATVPRGEIYKRLGYDPQGLKSMYEIPYGEGFSRYRCFYEEGKTGPKYLQKKDSGNRLFIPPSAASILADTKKLIYFTEGEKKALKASQEGLLCIGLSGLWNWKVKGGSLIPDFEKIELRDREVVIVPDNDYRKPNKHGYKKNLEKAVNDLVEALIDRGATVSIVELPDGPEKGLDDYLLTHSVEEFLALPVKEVQTLDGCAEKKEKRESKTKHLIELALDEAELFHDADKKAYATIRRDDHRETYPLRSRGFRTWLSGRFWAQFKDGCGGQIVQDALSTIEAHAIHEESSHRVYVRLALQNDRIYLDLGSDRFDVMEITSTGWRILEDQNVVKFRRPSGMAALPYPKESGSIDALKRYVNLANPDDWPLIVGFILGCFHPSGPYPILAVTGEQGSAKSTLLKVIKAITDPSTAPLRSTPKELRDLAISANNSWILAFDNLSNISEHMSDALCRLATGGGFSTRTLYLDDEETIFNTKRSVMLNCIDNVIRRHDLADRAIIINLAAIPEEKRIPEKEFWADFIDDAPEILGAILDAISCVLRNIDTVKLISYPRMADFAKWVTAAEPALDWKPETFLNAYRQNIHEVTSLTLDADLVGTAVNVFMEDKPTWEGTATELLNRLEGTADDRTKKAHDWPKAPHVLSGKLRRSATALRTHGIEIKFPTRTGRERLIRLEQVGKQSVTSVIEGENTVDDADIKDKSSMTLSKDRSVTGASYGYEERHTDRTNDASRNDNDAYLLGSVINPQGKTDDISIDYKVSDACDANDASIPPLFQNNRSEGIL